MVKISKPGSKGKGVPPQLDETPVQNLKRSEKSKRKLIPIEVDSDLHKEIKTNSVELEISIKDIFLEGYQLWKKKHNRI